MQKRLQTGITFVSRRKSEKSFSSVTIPRATWIKYPKNESLSFQKQKANVAG
jgi:hypothetical protein